MSGSPARLSRGLKWRLTTFCASSGVPLAVAKTSPESSYEPPAPSFSSSWRLRWRLRAASALCGRSTVRLEAFLGSEKTSLPGLPASSSRHPLQLAVDAQASAGEIHVRPLEPQGLAHPSLGRALLRRGSAPLATRDQYMQFGSQDKLHREAVLVDPASPPVTASSSWSASFPPSPTGEVLGSTR